MDITPIIDKNSNVINGYFIDGFTVNEQKSYDSIIINARLLENWHIQDINSFSLEELELLAKKLFNEKTFDNILLIGTGKNHVIPSNLQEFEAMALKYNINISFMSSQAACRTYNILLSEGRNISAAIIKITK